MYGERIQLLISKEQRRRLDREAKRRGTSVASLVREAVDARFGGPTREERLRAVEEIRNMGGGRFLTPEQLNGIAAEARSARWERVRRQNEP